MRSSFVDATTSPIKVVAYGTPTLAPNGKRLFIGGVLRGFDYPLPTPINGLPVVFAY